MRLHILGGVLGVLSVVAALGAKAGAPQQSEKNVYTQRNLVSDEAGQAEHMDTKLVNAWGLAFGAGGPAWVADNGTGFSTLYNGDGVKVPLDVIIPPEGNSAPTGIVSNATGGFQVTKSGVSAPSLFIFSTEDGTIAGWSPTLDMTHAIIAVDNSGAGAIYKGLAIATTGAGTFLYATDFHNARIDVFDSNFNPAMLPGTFQDPKIPAGFAPFGIQTLDGKLYVTYAKQDADAEDDVAGQGLGFVDAYDTFGNLIRRLVSHGQLNAPWGLARAPDDGFGRFSGRLLVGNFGDGTINAFDIDTGHFVGTLRGPDHHPLQIDGLWGLQFGNDANVTQPHTALFFTAGPDDESHGLFGRIEAAAGNDD